MTGEPQMLLHRGEFLPSALKQARVTRVTRDEIRTAVRSAGLPSLADAEAVVLETDGSFSVIRRGDGACPSSLEGVQTPRGDE